MKNRVLVLLPHFNNIAGLEASIASIHEDDHSDVLVIDDGSEVAPSEERLRQLYRANGELHLLALESNQGIVVALNRGLDYARRKSYRYVARLDAGDLNRRQRFTLQERFLDEHPEFVLVGSWVEFVDKERRGLFVLKHPVSDGEIRRAIYRYNPFVHPATMMRLEPLLKIGGYPTDYPALEDWACFLSLADKGKMANLPEVLLEYEVSPDSISTRERSQQARSKVRLLWHHFEWNTNQIVGLVRNLMVLYLPRSFLTHLKYLVYRKTDE